MKKVLIVNDCRFESLIMKDHLNDIGYSVEITNEYDVFTQIRKFQPDVVIANLIMRDTTGDKLIEYVKNINSKIVCLISSCNLIKLEDYVQQKVDEVIHTPIDKSQLSDILNRALSQYDKNDRKDINVNKLSFCPYCGHKLDQSDGKILFCPYCGQKIKN
jgi:DNA-binding NtrC family response regulator